MTHEHDHLMGTEGHFKGRAAGFRLNRSAVCAAIAMTFGVTSAYAQADRIDAMQAQIAAMQKELEKLRAEQAERDAKVKAAQTDAAKAREVATEVAARPAASAAGGGLVACPADAPGYYPKTGGEPLMIPAAPPMLRRSADTAKGYQIPGSDTCIRWGGRIRFDVSESERFVDTQNVNTSRTRAYLGFQTVTPTPIGAVRLNLGAIFQYDTAGGTSLTVNTGNIQVGGLTAGVLEHSLYDAYPVNYLGYTGGNQNGRGSDLQPTTTIAYSLRSGKTTFTVAAEDGINRRSGVASFNNTQPNLLGTQQPVFAGQNTPDLLTRTQYSDTWGNAILTTAIHKTGAVAPTPTNGNVFGGNAARGKSVYGYGIQAAVRVLLPQLGKTDQLTFQAAYADAANSYTGWTTVNSGTATMRAADVIYDNKGGVNRSKSWSLVGSLQHSWSDTLRSGLFVSYGKLDQAGPNYDAKMASVGHILTYSPEPKFNIGLELFYGRMMTLPVVFTQLAGASDSDTGVATARLRLQKDF